MEQKLTESCVKRKKHKILHFSLEFLINLIISNAPLRWHSVQGEVNSAFIFVKAAIRNLGMRSHTKAGARISSRH